MGLSGPQRKELQSALIDAFPTSASLEQILSYELDKNLREIAGEGSLQDIVFKLIQTANSEGWVEQLIRAACESNPGNIKLRVVAQKLIPNYLKSPSKLSRNIPSDSSGDSDESVIKTPSYSSLKNDNSNQFDVFLAHNSQDKPQVREIAQELKQRGLKPWLDEEQIPPGRPFQDEIQQAIPLVNSAAIFLGQRGLGRWQAWELRSLITQCVDRQIPVIPVLLPGVNEIPEKLLFLKEFHWVTFSNNLDDERALSLLQWGITGQNPETTVIPQPPDDLSSEKGVDYTRLRDLLKAENWKDADYETYLVMLKVVGGKHGDWIRYDELLNFPCTDLRTIDRLWVKYSYERFGFSVQKKIYIEVGCKPEEKYYKEAWDQFGDRIGWRVNQNWIYSLSVIYDTTAPVGHLPWVRFPNQRFFFSSLASRLVNCSR